MNTLSTNTRLASLDILRGFDMWLLFMFGPIAAAFVNINNGQVAVWLKGQITHVPWEGFVTWDIIMPLFMFLSGATIPFSMARYKEGQKPGKPFWFKLFKRFALLFFLGWIAQGNLLAFDPKIFHPYANTLQAIAVGYVASALIFVFSPTVKRQIVLIAVPFLLYILAFVCTGMNLDPQGNIAMLVDKAILGSHRGGVIWSDGGWSYSSGYQYTWILSSLNFTVTVMLGCFAGQIIRCCTHSPAKRAGILLATGAVLVACALGMSPFFPIVKKIWSSSMTLFAGGISFILLAIFYYTIDVKGRGKWLYWLKYYGMNAIVAYMIGDIINFSSVSKSILFGFEKFLGAYYPLLIAVANTFILFFILKILYKRSIFLKV